MENQLKKNRQRNIQTKKKERKKETNKQIKENNRKIDKMKFGDCPF